MKRAFQILKRDMRRLAHNPIAMIVVAGVCLLPSLYAWFNIAANMDPYGNTGAVQIAVANLDKGTENELTGSLNAGEEIVDQLKENHDLGWKFVKKEEAVDGVKSGKYYAAIVIPEDFSESLTSVLTGKLRTVGRQRCRVRSMRHLYLLHQKQFQKFLKIRLQMQRAIWIRCRKM